MLYKFVIGGVLLAGIVNIYLFHSLGILGVILFLLLLTLIGVFGYGLNQFSKNWALLATIIVFSVLSVSRGAKLPQLLLTAGAFTTFCLLWYLTITHVPFVNSLFELLMVPFKLFTSYLSSIVRSIGELLQVQKKQSSPIVKKIFEWIPSVLVGLLIGFPFVAFLLILLINADPIFAKTLSNIVDTLTIGESAFRILIGLVSFLSLIPLSFMSNKRASLSPNFISPTTHKPMTVVMLMIAVTLAIFLVIQWPYIFATVNQEQNLSNFGVSTYSEYVKKGFGEFLVTASILYAALWVGLISLRGYIGKKRPVLFYVQTIVIFLFTVFLLSIVRRILLYWEFHGLTVIRLYGGLFLGWVGFLTSMLLMRSLKKFQWVTIETIGTIALLIFIGFWNAEHVIVKNHPPTVNNSVDIVYLSRLSPDGYDGWKDAYTIAKRTIYELVNKPGLLTEDDRRKAAYSGIALGLLNRNYYRLTSFYGTDQEKQEFSKEIMNDMSVKLTDAVGLFTRDMNILQQKGDTATVSAEMYVHANQGHKSFIVNEQLDRLRSAASFSATLQTQSRNIGFFAHMKPRSPITVADFSTGICWNTYWLNSPTEQGSSCIPAFYVLTEHNNQPDALDRLFHFNIQEHQVYRNMKVDMPIKEFFALQQQYSFVWKRIIEQPTPERSYNQDVSYEAPFVASIW